MALNLAVGVGSGAGPTLAQLTAQLTGLFEAQARITANPPNLASLLGQAQALIAAIQAAILAGVPPVDVQLLAIGAAIADIQLQIGQLQALIDLSASVTTMGATVQCAVYTGPAAQCGGPIGSYFGSGIQGAGPSADSVILCIGATASPSQAAMTVMFGV